MKNQTGNESISDAIWMKGYAAAKKEMQKRDIVIIGNKGYLLTASQYKALRKNLDSLGESFNGTPEGWGEALEHVEKFSECIFTASEILNY